MQVRTEKNEFMPAEIYVEEILSEGLGLEQVTEEEAEEALAELYANGYSEELATVFNPGIMAMHTIDVGTIKKRELMVRLKVFLCDFINGEGKKVWGEIVEKILEFISGMIPGGILVKKLVKIIVKYILGRGIEKLCAAV